MRVGKLTPAELEQNVFRHLTERRAEVSLRSGLGEDSTIFDFGGQVCVMSTDPITGAVEDAGWLAVHISANDVASNGAEPVCCLLTILAPADCAMAEIDRVMQDAARAAEELKIEISGGHTELTAAVNQMVLSSTVVGKADRNRIIRTGGALAGDDIVVTKTIGLEGTSILAKDAASALLQWFPADLLDTAAQLGKRISVVPEGRVAAAFGVHAMHDITEGGLLGAVYEMASGAGKGFWLQEKAVPLHPATLQFCRQLQLDPLRLIASGSMLIATERGAALVEQLAAAGISAAVIGKFTAEPEKILIQAEGSTIVAPPEGDELWRALTFLGKSCIN
ncbi:MAG: AIR synthase family protein [Oscillospiraceae bacterium]|nr:AIR synthase family protein [Oscillospiraceae bacterium]